MYLLAVLCLLSAAVALPTPEELHTNVPEPPAPELPKSEEKADSNERIPELDLSTPSPPPPPVFLDESIPLSEDSKEWKKSGELKDEDKVVHEPKEEKKEFIENKHDSKEDKIDSNEEKFDSKEEKKSKDEKKDSREEKKDSKEDVDKKIDDLKPAEVPLEVQRPRPSFLNFLASLFDLPSFGSPFHWFGRARDGHGPEPIIIIRESDFDFDD